MIIVSSCTVIGNNDTYSQGPVVWVLVTIGAIMTWWFSLPASWLAQEKVDKAFEGANSLETYSVESGDAIELIDVPMAGNGE